MNLALIEDANFKPADHDVERCLVELEKYGMPRLSKHDTGWRCEIDVFVTGEGVSFDVVSRANKTPKDAVNICFERLIDAIKKIKDT